MVQPTRAASKVLATVVAPLIVRLLIGAAIGGAVGASASTAHADGAGVVVVSASRSAAPASDVARSVALAADADVDAIATARRARAAGAVPLEDLVGFAQVARLEAEGWRAYQVAVDAEFAASRLASARSHAEALLPLPGGVEAYAEASLRLGLVLAHLGRRDEAAEALRLAHALDPARPVTTAEFSPDGVAASEAAIAASPPVTDIAITATARASLTVDGTDVGRAPVTVALSLGQHVIVARSPGRAARGVAVSVGPDTRTIDVDLELVASVGLVERDDALAAGASETRAGAAIAEVLTYAELDELFVVASVYRGGGPALLGQRCVLARPACTAIVEIGHVDGGLGAAARELIERLRGASVRYGVLLPADARVARGERRIDGGERCRWCRNPWVIGGGGVVAAALVTAATIALTRDDPNPVVTVDPGDFTD